MKNSSKWCFFIQFCLLFFMRITLTQQLCPPPDVPLNGNYFPRENSYQWEDVVTYRCNNDYLARGDTRSQCGADGHWSNQMPFCDPEAEVENYSSTDSQGNAQPVPQVVIDTPSACFSLQAGESLRITLQKPQNLHVVGIYLIQGNINIEITNGSAICSTYTALLGAHRWEFLRCRRQNILASYVTIQEKSTQGNSTFCNVKIYTNGDGCDNPPRRRIANGYFEVSRSLARLICRDGYEADKKNDRLVCEENSWVGKGLQCKKTSIDYEEISSNEVLERNTDATTTDTAGVSCPPPDVARSGNYFPRKYRYSPEDEVTYRCNDDFLQRGSRISTCREDGYWSFQTPFCDPEAEIRHISSFDSQGNEQPVPQVVIDTPSACFSLQAGESLRMTLEKPNRLYVVGMYLIQGNIDIEITNGSGICSTYKALLGANRWEFIRCRQFNLYASDVIIKEKSTQENSTFCNVKIYTSGEGCDNPPRRRIPHGHLEVTRSLAKLICDEGYEIDGYNDRLVCEDNTWIGKRLQCKREKL